jgi:hypothetical protein
MLWQLKRILVRGFAAFRAVRLCLTAVAFSSLEAAPRFDGGTASYLNGR